MIPNSQEVIIMKEWVHILPCLLYLMLLLVLQFLEMITPFLWAILPPESFLYSELLFFFPVSYFFSLLLKKLLDKISCHFQFKVHYFLFVFERRTETVLKRSTYNVLKKFFRKIEMHTNLYGCIQAFVSNYGRITTTYI